MRKISHLFTLLTMCLIAGERFAWAETIVGMEVGGGAGQSALHLSGGFDLGVKRKWSALADLAASQSSGEVESHTKQAIVGLQYHGPKSCDLSAKFNYWKDTDSKLTYIGPSLGFMYTFRKDGDHTTTFSGPTSRLNEGYELLDEADFWPQRMKRLAENSTGLIAEPQEILSIRLDVDVFFYTAEITTSSRTVLVFDPVLGKNVPQIIPSGTRNPQATQTHPTLSVDMPFLDGRLVPNLTVGHYFYSRDPREIQRFLGRQHLPSLTNQVNSILSGLLWKNGSAGFSAFLPLDFILSASLGADQAVVDNSWATVQSATLGRFFGDHLQLKSGWTRVIQNGHSSDFWTAGFDWAFKGLTSN